MSDAISNITFSFFEFYREIVFRSRLLCRSLSIVPLRTTSIPRQNVHVSRKFLTLYTETLISRTFTIFNIPELKSNAQITNIMPLNRSDRATSYVMHFTYLSKTDLPLKLKNWMAVGVFNLNVVFIRSVSVP